MFRIGIICNESNVEDITAYKKEFIIINERFGDKIELVLVGYNGQDEKLLEEVEFEYIKPVSIIHYFKQIKALKLNLIFVPLIRNVYNITSENYNKYLEAGLMKIPILALNIFPYNKIIKDKMNGFIYQDKGEFIAIIDMFMRERDLISLVGQNAEKDVLENFNYSEDNIKVLSDLFVTETKE